MIRRRKRSVLLLAITFCSFQALYYLLQLDIQTVQRSLEYDVFVPTGLQGLRNDSRQERDKNSLLTDKVNAHVHSHTNNLVPSVSLDKSADVNTSTSHRKAVGTTASKQQSGPTNSSKTTPGGAHARLPGTCSSVGLPAIPGPGSDWQTVESHSSFAYSAFLEKRLDRNEIKIIGTSNIHSKSYPMYCYLWYRNSTSPVIKRVSINYLVPETHSRRFAVFLYRCPLESYKRKSQTPPPVAVSLSNSNNKSCETTPQNVLLVQNRQKKISNNYTVCISVIQKSYNNVHQLVEFVEIHRLYGAEKFVFYNLSMGRDVQMYLEFYMRQGIADVIPYTLPKVVDAHYKAQVASLNDCLYRYMYKSKYIAFIDLDEVIVPKTHHNWTALMSSLEGLQHSAKICGFQFRCVFFRTDWDNSTHWNTSSPMHVAIRNNNINILLKNKREKKIWGYRQRSKLIANPRKVDIMGVHNVWKPLRDYMEYDVAFETAALHHYRWWDDVNNNWMIDETMFEYAAPLVDRVQKIVKLVGRGY